MQTTSTSNSREAPSRTSVLVVGSIKCTPPRTTEAETLRHALTGVPGPFQNMDPSGPTLSYSFLKLHNLYTSFFQVSLPRKPPKQSRTKNVHNLLEFLLLFLHYFAHNQLMFWRLICAGPQVRYRPRHIRSDRIHLCWSSAGKTPRLHLSGVGSRIAFASSRHWSLRVRVFPSSALKISREGSARLVTSNVVRLIFLSFSLPVVLLQQWGDKKSISNDFDAFASFYFSCLQGMTNSLVSLDVLSLVQYCKVIHPSFAVVLIIAIMLPSSKVSPTPRVVQGWVTWQSRGDWTIISHL